MFLQLWSNCRKPTSVAHTSRSCSCRNENCSRGAFRALGLAEAIERTESPDRTSLLRKMAKIQRGIGTDSQDSCMSGSQCAISPARALSEIATLQCGVHILLMIITHALTCYISLVKITVSTKFLARLRAVSLVERSFVLYQPEHSPQTA